MGRKFDEKDRDNTDRYLGRLVISPTSSGMRGERGEARDVSRGYAVGPGI